MGSLLESEQGEEAVGCEGSGEERGPLSVAHQASMERSLVGGQLDAQDLRSAVRLGGGSPTWFLGSWPITKPTITGCIEGFLKAENCYQNTKKEQIL